MECPSCGSLSLPGHRFCAQCGTRLDAACPNCGQSLPSDARFCPACGERTSPSQADDGKAASTTPTVARLEPVAERRLVSVLFCDLVGFTADSQDRDAEETREILTAYYELARERIGRYGGTVEKFIGDAVMAVWGVPQAREDDPERAVRAALDLVSAVPQVAAGSSARAAVMTGEAAVTLGAQGQGMVAGDLVNVASRLQSVADPGTVLVGETTRAASEKAIAYDAVGDRQLKGVAPPVATWRALRAVGMVGGRNASDELEPPFVGRDAELRFITELYHAAARERRLRHVSVTGQPGIGKSRLSRELEKYLDGISETVFWHRGRCPAYGEGLTFWAIGEMVRRRAGIAEGDDAETTGQRIRSMLDEFVVDPSERARIEPAVRALLGLDTVGWSVSETGELYAAWRALFERIAEQGPVVLVFEDLQWADDGIVGFIGHLLEWSRNQPILIVTLARPEFLDVRPTWGAGLRSFASLHLEPLPEGAIADMLAGVVPGLPPAMARSIARRAGGVPLYAVETIRMLIAQGVLAREGNAFRVTSDLEEIAVPDSLRGLVAARLDTLPTAERARLQDAAVLGHSFSVHALAAVAGLTAEELEPVLRGLVRRELLRQETDARSPERGQYLWVQAVIREVAYATLSKRDRRAKHLSAARYFEKVGDEEVAGILAEHYLEAWRASGDGPDADALAGQARVALRAAADRAARLRNWRQAASFVTRGLDVTVDESERPRLLERIGEMLARAGSWPEAEARFREALVALPSGADRDDRARLAASVGQQILNELRVAEGLTFLRAAVDEHGPELSTAGRVQLEGQLGRALFLSERRAEAQATLERTIDAAERSGPLEALVEAIISLGSNGMYLGHSSGLAMVFGGLELARQHGFVPAELRALNNLATWAYLADPKVEREMVDRIVEVCDRVGFDAVQWQVDFPPDLLMTDGLDEAERREAELAERVRPGGLEENTFLLAQLTLRALRGDADAFDAARQRLEGSAERSEEARLQIIETAATGLALLGRVDAAESTLAGTDDERVGFVRLLVTLQRSDRAAVERAMDALPRMTTWEGPFGRGLRQVGEAAARLLTAPRNEDVVRYLEGLTELQASRRAGEWTLAGVAAIRIIGLDRPDVRDAIALLRSEVERIGAWACVRLIDEAVAHASSEAPAPTDPVRPATRSPDPEHAPA